MQILTAPNDRPIIDPSENIAKAAGYRYPTPKPSDPRKDPNLATNTRRRLAKKHANLSPFLGELISGNDHKQLLGIQRRSEELIAVINANVISAVKAAYEQEVAGLHLSPSQLKALYDTAWQDLPARLQSAKAKLEIAEAALFKLVNEETKPRVISILELALARARVEHTKFTETELAWWSRYGIDYESSELGLAVRDAVERLELAITTRLNGHNGEVTPRNLLATYLPGIGF